MFFISNSRLLVLIVFCFLIQEVHVQAQTAFASQVAPVSDPVFPKMPAAHNETEQQKSKSDKKEIDDALPKLLLVQGYYYPNPSNPTQNLKNGVSPKELENLVPEAVSTDENGDKSIRHDQLTTLLVEAVKEQQHLIEVQQHEIRLQEEQLRQQTAALAAIQARLEALETK